MANYDISKLESRQEEHEKRKKGLIQNLELYKEGFIEGIRLFLNEAKDIGLLNNKRLKMYKSKEPTHYLFTINGFNLVLVSTNNVADLSVRNGMKFRSSRYILEGIEKIQLSALASMIFLYREGSKGSPLIKITIYESSENKYNYVMEWNTTDGTEAISGGFAMTKDDGLNASKELVNFLYSFSTTWKENPTLEEVLGDNTQSRAPFGFQVKDK